MLQTDPIEETKKRQIYAEIKQAGAAIGKAGNNHVKNEITSIKGAASTDLDNFGLHSCSLGNEWLAYGWISQDPSAKPAKYSVSILALHPRISTTDAKKGKVITKRSSSTPKFADYGVKIDTRGSGKAKLDIFKEKAIFTVPWDTFELEENKKLSTMKSGKITSIIVSPLYSANTRNILVVCATQERHDLNDVIVWCAFYRIPLKGWEADGNKPLASFIVDTHIDKNEGIQL